MWRVTLRTQAGQEADSPCRRRTAFYCGLSSQVTASSLAVHTCLQAGPIPGIGGQVSVPGWAFLQSPDPCDSFPHCLPIHLPTKSPLAKSQAPTSPVDHETTWPNPHLQHRDPRMSLSLYYTHQEAGPFSLGLGPVTTFQRRRPGWGQVTRTRSYLTSSTSPQYSQVSPTPPPSL